MHGSGALSTCLGGLRGYSNCEAPDTQSPCARHTVLAPTPSRGPPHPSSRAKQDWWDEALRSCPPGIPALFAIQWDLGVCARRALCPRCRCRDDRVLGQQSGNGRGSSGQTPTQETPRKGACLAALDQEIPAGRMPPPPCHPDPSPARHISDPCQAGGRGVGGRDATPPLHAILAAACV